MIGTLIQIDAQDAAGAAVTIQLASHDDERLCHLDGGLWWPVVQRLPTLRYDLYSGAFDGKIDTPASDLTIGIEPWPAFGGYRFADARLRIWRGAIGDAWGSFTLLFDGRVQAQPAIDLGIATLRFAVDDRWLDTPLLALYAGTSGIEGGADLAGTPKPLAIGAPRFASGPMIDTVNNVVQLSAYGAINGIEYALERLARFGASVGNCANYAALVAASVPAGRWATANAYGLVRHGAPPTGLLSYLMQGDAAGPDGWIRTPGKIIRRIALLAGGGGKIDDASLDALDTLWPVNLSLLIKDQVTAREMIQRIAASINAVAGVSWLGKLFVAPIALPSGSALIGAGGGDGIGAGGGAGLGTEGPIGSAVITLSADGSTLPAVASVQQIESGAPAWRIAIEAERTWTVHGLGDIAFTATLVPRGDYDAAATYREGNIVQKDGASWLYINPVATVGNAPPNATYWQWLSASSVYDLDYTGDLNATYGATSDQIAAIASAQSAADAAQATADGKIETFYQTTAPSGGSYGDLWFDTDDGNKLYRHNGTTWVVAVDADIANAITAAAGAQATADGKVTTFYATSTPTAEALGDLWYNSSTGYLKRWSGSAWVDVSIWLDTSGNINTGKAVTASLAVAAVTDSVQAYNGSLVTGSGAFVDVISFDIDMDHDGDIYVWLSAKQSYSGSTPSWQGKLLVDTTEIFYTGGAVLSDSISMCGKLSVVAGTRTITFSWYGSASDISIAAGAASMIAMRAYR
jgi:hypothetical protein